MFHFLFLDFNLNQYEAKCGGIVCLSHSWPYLTCDLYHISFLSFLTGERLGYVAMILVLYGWAIIPLMYIFSFMFVVPTTAFTRMTILNVCTGQAALLVIFILGILNELDTRDVFKWIFLFMPNYNLGQSIVDLSTNYMFISGFTTDNLVSMCVQFIHQNIPQFPRQNATVLCKLPLRSYNGEGKISITQCEADLNDFVKQFVKIPFPYADQLCNMVQTALDKSTQFFQWNYLAWETPGIGRYLIFMALEGFLFFGIVLFIEYGVLRRLMCRRNTSQASSGTVNPTESRLSDVSVGVNMDTDVADERDRVLNQGDTGDVLLMKGVTKVFKVQGRYLKKISLVFNKLLFHSLT